MRWASPLPSATRTSSSAARSCWRTRSRRWRRRCAPPGSGRARAWRASRSDFGEVRRGRARGRGRARAPRRCTSRWSRSASQPGDEVIVPAMTFAATANAVDPRGRRRPSSPTSTRETMSLAPGGCRGPRDRRARARSFRCTSPGGPANRGDRRARDAARVDRDRGLRARDRDASTAAGTSARSAASARSAST